MIKAFKIIFLAIDDGSKNDLGREIFSWVGEMNHWIFIGGRGEQDKESELQEHIISFLLLW